MKLTTEYGELPLPEDMEITIEETHPAFSTEGTSSIPITIPATAQAMAALKQPARLGSANRLRKVAATLSEGVYHKNGQLIIDSASADGGITCAFSYAEGDFYAKYKAEKLRNFIDNGALPIPFVGGIEAAYEHLLGVYYGEIPALYTVCPVAVDYKDGMYSVNNRPVADGGLEYKSRYLQDSGSDTKTLVPDGYGLAPFLYLHSLLDKVFFSLGYTVSYNVFAEDEDLSKIIVLHNLSDMLCSKPLLIRYSDMTPDITVSDLLDWLHDKFLAYVVADSGRMTVGIYLLQDILALRSYDEDLSNRINGDLKIVFKDSSRVVINVDTSLDGAAAGEKTFDDFVRKYPAMQDVAPANFSDEASVLWYRYMFIRNKATGMFYATKNTPLAFAGATMATLGSSYFNYDKGGDSEGETFAPADLLPPMVFVDGILMPYIGPRRHRYTQLNGEKESSEDQKIIIAYDAGYRDSGYRLATTQKYDETGEEWGVGYSLNTVDVYTRFFSRYNGLIAAGKVEVSGKLHLSMVEQQNWKIGNIFLCRGQLMLCQSRSYSILKNKAVEGSSNFILLNGASDPDTQPQFGNLEYYWVMDLTNAEARMDELEEAYSANDRFKEVILVFPELTSDEYVRPTVIPTSEGETAFYDTIPITYRVMDNENDVIGEATEDTGVWWISRKIQ